jgi:hypothetical protein
MVNHAHRILCSSFAVAGEVDGKTNIIYSVRAALFGGAAVCAASSMAAESALLTAVRSRVTPWQAPSLQFSLSVVTLEEVSMGLAHCESGASDRATASVVRVRTASQ